MKSVSGGARRAALLVAQLTGAEASAATMSIEKIPGITAGAVVRNVDFAALSDEDFNKIHAAFLEFGFLVFPEQQSLTKRDQAAFGARFGKLEFAANTMSNRKKDGSFWPLDTVVHATNKVNEAWHTDSSFKPQSSKMAMLYSEVLPPSGGGETELCDMRHAYESLEEPLKARIEELSAYHALRYSLARRTGVEPPRRMARAITRQPTSGRW